MAICKFCGGEIKFRTIDGKRMPIKISCTCSGYSKPNSHEERSKSISEVFITFFIMLYLHFKPRSAKDKAALIEAWSQAIFWCYFIFYILVFSFFAFTRTEQTFFLIDIVVSSFKTIKYILFFSPYLIFTYIWKRIHLNALKKNKYNSWLIYYLPDFLLPVILWYVFYHSIFR